MQVSVARYLRTPPYAARRKGLDFDSSNCLRSQSNRSTIVVCNCTVWAGTVAPRRDKANPFRRPSILFRPHDPQTKDVGGAAGYRPRVRSAYYERVYVHSSSWEQKSYSRLMGGCKGGTGILRRFRPVFRRGKPAIAGPAAARNSSQESWPFRTALQAKISRSQLSGERAEPELTMLGDTRFMD